MGNLAWLETLSPWPAEFGLGTIRALLARLGDPQLAYPSIHVVGTNGKSSVAEMAGALLEAHGKRTGVYLSPHTERWSERVRIRGAEIDADDLAAAAERVALQELHTAREFEPPGDAARQLGIELPEGGLGGRRGDREVAPLVGARDG